MSNKQKYNLIFIIGVSVVTTVVCGALLSHLFYSRLHNDSTVIKVDEHVSEEMIVEFEDLIPGATKEFNFKIKPEKKRIYVVSIDYIEIEEGDLKKYLDVVIMADGEVVCEKSLEELLNDEGVVSFERTISPKDPLEIEIKYNMPTSVGNEAQKAESKFKIEITVSQK